MDISGLGPFDDVSIDGAIEAQKAKEAERDELGRDQFLTMLIAQLQSQDPLNPADSTEFSAQLAQFSSLEQLVAVRESVDQMREAFEASVNEGGVSDADLFMQMSSMIGKEVTAVGEQVFVPEEGEIVIPFGLAKDATDFKLTIRDQDRRTVAEITNMGIDPATKLAIMPEAGANDLVWDGIGVDGERVAPGKYDYEIMAFNGAESLTYEPVMRGVVTGAAVHEGVPVLKIGDRYVPLTDVFSVEQAPVGGS